MLPARMSNSEGKEEEGEGEDREGWRGKGIEGEINPLVGNALVFSQYRYFLIMAIKPLEFHGI